MSCGVGVVGGVVGCGGDGVHVVCVIVGGVGVVNGVVGVVEDGVGVVVVVFGGGVVVCVWLVWLLCRVLLE